MAVARSTTCTYPSPAATSFSVTSASAPSGVIATSVGVWASVIGVPALRVARSSGVSVPPSVVTYAVPPSGATASAFGLGNEIGAPALFVAVAIGVTVSASWLTERTVSSSGVIASAPGATGVCRAAGIVCPAVLRAVSTRRDALCGRDIGDAAVPSTTVAPGQVGATSKPIGCRAPEARSPRGSLGWC